MRNFVFVLEWTGLAHQKLGIGQVLFIRKHKALKLGMKFYKKDNVKKRVRHEGLQPVINSEVGEKCEQEGVE